MEEFSQYYERDDVEMISDIPSGFIRKGLFVFLALIVILIGLSCFIKVNKNTQVQSRILTDKPVKIDVTSFGINTAANLSYGNDSTHTIKSLSTFRGISYIENGKGIILIKRNFSKMKDSIFTFPPNTNIKLFVTNGDTSKVGKLNLGQQVDISYLDWNYNLSSRVVNVLNNSDGSYTYQLDISRLPKSIKYLFLSMANVSVYARLKNVRITLFQQIYSNLFNKIKI